MKYLKKFNENKLSTKDLFKGKINWKIINWFEYLVTKYADEGIDVLFSLEIDRYMIWSVGTEQHSTHHGFYELSQSNLAEVEYKYEKEGFDYLISINTIGKSAVEELEKLKMKVFEKFDAEVKKITYTHSYIIFKIKGIK